MIAGLFVTYLIVLLSFVCFVFCCLNFVVVLCWFVRCVNSCFRFVCVVVGFFVFCVLWCACFGLFVAC